MWPLLILFGGAGALAIAMANDDSVPEGALPGCSFNGQDLHTWGEANGISILIDGNNWVGANHNVRIPNVLHWTTGSRVLMTSDGLSADWVAVNSYCRFNLAKGSVRNAATPGEFKLSSRLANAASPQVGNFPFLRNG